MLLAWPAAGMDWDCCLEEIRHEYEQLLRAISHSTPVLLLAPPGEIDAVRRRLRVAGIPDHRLQLVPIALDDTWIRDYGPLAVRTEAGIGLVDFRFDGWGGRYPSTRDDAATRRLATGGWLGDPPLTRVDWVLEGGAIDTDGQGTLLTTERCLLDPRRGGDRDRDAVERRLQQSLGIRHVHWLRHGGLEGDDTDGHVDMLARFCDPGTIAHVQCDDPSYPWYDSLRLLADELARLRTPGGGSYRLVPLPLPQPMPRAPDGRLLPASHLNFLILDDQVLVPAYGRDSDRIARERLAPCFPERQVRLVASRTLIRQNGSLHCATLQLPRVDRR